MRPVEVGSINWLQSHRRILAFEHKDAVCRLEKATTWSQVCRPSANAFFELIAVHAFQKVKMLENKKRQLDEAGIVYIGTEVVQLSPLSRTWNDKLLRDENTHQAIDDAMLQLMQGISCPRTAASARACGGAAPGAGEAAASGAGQASTSGSRPRSRCRSS